MHNLFASNTFTSQECNIPQHILRKQLSGDIIHAVFFNIEHK